ncbi:MAG: hypothetical protein G01um10145_73 [Microgenomates group bacterium Gr01-1014_5]|nr:MAG: hypothetical protein G01um10145_73 [Microgenomates group bacterium Gr01-1014_5]
MIPNNEIGRQDYDEARRKAVALKTLCRELGAGNQKPLQYTDRDAETALNNLQRLIRDGFVTTYRDVAFVVKNTSPFMGTDYPDVDLAAARVQEVISLNQRSSLFELRPPRAE